MPAKTAPANLNDARGSISLSPQGFNLLFNKRLGRPLKVGLYNLCFLDYGRLSEYNTENTDESAFEGQSGHITANVTGHKTDNAIIDQMKESLMEGLGVDKVIVTERFWKPTSDIEFEAGCPHSFKSPEEDSDDISVILPYTQSLSNTVEQFLQGLVSYCSENRETLIHVIGFPEYSDLHFNTNLVQFIQGVRHNTHCLSSRKLETDLTLFDVNCASLDIDPSSHHTSDSEDSSDSSLSSTSTAISSASCRHAAIPAFLSSILQPSNDIKTQTQHTIISKTYDTNDIIIPPPHPSQKRSQPLLTLGKVTIRKTGLR